MNVFKKRRRNPRTGKIELGRYYYFKHRFDGDAKPTERSLGVADKEVAEKRAKEIVNREERRRAGLWIDEAEKAAADQQLTQLIDEYVRGLASEGCVREHFRKVDQRLKSLCTQLGWTKIADIQKKDFRKWIRAAGMKPKTLQHYQSTAVAFSRWLHKEGMCPESPLDGLPMIRGVGVCQSPPTSLSTDEASRLLEASPGYRRDFYAIMLYTGLRPIEVGRLKVENVVSRDGKVFLRLDPSQSKARRIEWQEVPAILVSVLDRLVNGRSPGARLLAKGEPTRATFQRDLKRAGIEAIRPEGGKITKYALRRTFITWTHAVTESPGVRQKLARHVSEYLTEKIYTDRLALNLHDVVNRLPAVGGIESESAAASTIASESAEGESAETRSTKRELHRNGSSERQSGESDGVQVFRIGDYPRLVTHSGLEAGREGVLS